ncbi:MAG: hypothetical protein ACK41P_03870 [Asticcacaulis sp.]
MSGGQNSSPLFSEARFRALADAYGADLSRWPVGEQHAARLWQSTYPEPAALILSEAGLLDQWLDQALPSVVPEALTQAVYQQQRSLQARILRRAQLSLWTRIMEDLARVAHQLRARPAPLFAGMGLATAALTGLLIGLVFMPVSSAPETYGAEPSVAVQGAEIELQEAALTEWLSGGLDETEYSL